MVKLFKFLYSSIQCCVSCLVEMYLIVFLQTSLPAHPPPVSGGRDTSVAQLSTGGEERQHRFGPECEATPGQTRWW